MLSALKTKSIRFTVQENAARVNHKSVHFLFSFCCFEFYGLYFHILQQLIKSVAVFQIETLQNCIFTISQEDCLANNQSIIVFVGWTLTFGSH